MERHGYYKKYTNISGKKYYIRILRVRCKVCGHTHAILPDFIVPYLHNPIIDLLELVTNLQKDLDENQMKLKQKINKKWKSILHSLNITFKHKLQELVFLCSRQIKMCFMQIHRGKYYYQV